MRSPAAPSTVVAVSPGSLISSWDFFAISAALCGGRTSTRKEAAMDSTKDTMSEPTAAMSRTPCTGWLCAM